MSPAPQPENKKTEHGSRARWIILLAVVVIIVVWGIASRIEAATDLKKSTRESAVAQVNVMTVTKGKGEEVIVLPGNVQAWHEAPIYARTSGYLKEWKTDIGTHVKAGDLLAEIDTPDVDAQLHQAEADFGTATANNKLAQTTAKRWEALLKTNAVSKQDVDDKTGAAAASAATMAASQANLDRLRQQEDFKHVVAPFDGTITARNTDNGALINAGQSTGQELFRLAETGKLRVYVQVPQTYSTDITPDLTAELHFAEHPQQVFQAKLEKTADALDPTTRTLLIQLVVDNQNGDLLPGGYTEVHLKLPTSNTNVRLPVNTLLFRNGNQVAVIDGDKAVLKNIEIGRDFGTEVEVTNGVSEGDVLIVNPPDSISDGQRVKIVKPKNDNGNAAPAKKDDSKKDDAPKPTDDSGKDQKPKDNP
jgi:RND family efflux transporter MFP subunit